MYPTLHQARRAVLAVLLVAAAAGLAACGSSSSASSASSSSSAAAGGAGSSAASAKFSACLKSHGVTLPQRGAGAPAGGAAGGRAPGGRRGGFFGGAGGRGASGSAKDRAAFSACRKDLPQGGRSRGGPGSQPTGGGRFSPTALTKFSACVKQHGYTLPKPDTSGKGPVFPRSIESSATFQKAARACSADLRPAGGTTASG
jgi:hypothetical protein